VAGREAHRAAGNHLVGGAGGISALALEAQRMLLMKRPASTIANCTCHCNAAASGATDQPRIVMRACNCVERRRSIASCVGARSPAAAWPLAASRACSCSSWAAAAAAHRSDGSRSTTGSGTACDRWRQQRRSRSASESATAPGRGGASARAAAGREGWRRRRRAGKSSMGLSRARGVKARGQRRQRAQREVTAHQSRDGSGDGPIDRPGGGAMRIRP